MKKKLISIMLCGMLAVSLAACGSSSTDSAADDATEDTVSTADEADDASAEPESDTGEVSGDDVEDAADADAEETESLSPDDYIDAVYSYNAVVVIYANYIMNIGGYMGPLFIVESYTPDDVLAYGISKFDEDNEDISGEDVENSVLYVSDTLNNTIANVPDDEECEEWYEQANALTACYANLYSTVINSVSDYEMSVDGSTSFMSDLADESNALGDAIDDYNSFLTEKGYSDN